MMIDQYERYEVEVETDVGTNVMSVNGSLTLGENIADLGGVALSLRALEDEMKDKNLNISINDKKKFFEIGRASCRERVFRTV